MQDLQKCYGLDMQGPFKFEELPSLPAFVASDFRRLVAAAGAFYVGMPNGWLDISTSVGKLDVIVDLLEKLTALPDGRSGWLDLGVTPADRLERNKGLSCIKDFDPAVGANHNCVFVNGSLRIGNRLVTIPDTKLTFANGPVTVASVSRVEGFLEVFRLAVDGNSPVFYLHGDVTAGTTTDLNHPDVAGTYTPTLGGGYLQNCIRPRTGTLNDKVQGMAVAPLSGSSWDDISGEVAFQQGTNVTGSNVYLEEIYKVPVCFVNQFNSAVWSENNLNGSASVDGLVPSGRPEGWFYQQIPPSRVEDTRIVIMPTNFSANNYAEMASDAISALTTGNAETSSSTVESYVYNRDTVSTITVDSQIVSSLVLQADGIKKTAYPVAAQVNRVQYSTSGVSTDPDGLRTWWGNAPGGQEQAIDFYVENVDASAGTGMYPKMPSTAFTYNNSSKRITFDVAAMASNSLGFADKRTKASATLPVLYWGISGDPVTKTVTYDGASDTIYIDIDGADAAAHAGQAISGQLYVVYHSQNAFLSKSPLSGILGVQFYRGVDPQFSHPDKYTLLQEDKLKTGYTNLFGAVSKQVFSTADDFEVTAGVSSLVTGCGNNIIFYGGQYYKYVATADKLFILASTDGQDWSVLNGGSSYATITSLGFTAGSAITSISALNDSDITLVLGVTTAGSTQLYSVAAGTNPIGPFTIANNGDPIVDPVAGFSDTTHGSIIKLNTNEYRLVFSARATTSDPYTVHMAKHTVKTGVYPVTNLIEIYDSPVDCLAAGAFTTGTWLKVLAHVDGATIFFQTKLTVDTSHICKFTHEMAPETVSYGIVGPTGSPDLEVGTVVSGGEVRNFLFMRSLNTSMLNMALGEDDGVVLFYLRKPNPMVDVSGSGFTGKVRWMSPTAIMSSLGTGGIPTTAYYDNDRYKNYGLLTGFDQSLYTGQVFEMMFEFQFAITSAQYREGTFKRVKYVVDENDPELIGQDVTSLVLTPDGATGRYLGNFFNNASIFPERVSELNPGQNVWAIIFGIVEDSSGKLFLASAIGDEEGFPYGALYPLASNTYGS